MYNYEFFRKQNSGVQSLIKWQFNEHGGFFTALWKAISTADEFNLACLEKAYPLHVEAYRKYAHEDGWWEQMLIELRKTEVA